MTKKQVLASLREMWAEICEAEPMWRGDSIAKRESFNNFVDSVNKDGEVSDSQAHNWSNPF